MTTDPILLFLQILGVVAAAASAISAYLNWRVASANVKLSGENLSLAAANREYTRQATNRQAASKHEEQIALHPQLLDLHGFSHQNLQALNLTQVEVAYLLSSFTAGDLYYQDGTIKELTQYRKVLLQSTKVQTAWIQILKGKFIGSGPFSWLTHTFQPIRRPVPRFWVQQSRPNSNVGPRETLRTGTFLPHEHC